MPTVTNGGVSEKWGDSQQNDLEGKVHMTTEKQM